VHCCATAIHPDASANTVASAADAHSHPCFDVSTGTGNLDGGSADVD
jgi:hypothetical protein